MSLTRRPLSDLLAAFSDPSPTPGGGSASALAASVGLSLLTMVAGMSRTRNGDDEDRQALDAAAEALVHLRDRAADLIDEDSNAYDQVVAAYRLAKAKPDDQARRGEAIQSALRGAAAVPLDLMRTCQAGLVAAGDVARHGNPAAASDVGVALELLMAALKGGALNVKANLDALTDAGYVAALRTDIAHLEASCQRLRTELDASRT
jgi:methenyltetrahydrofolate cyclohydrolase